MIRRHWPVAGFLVALPVLIAVIAPIQLFSPPGWVDPSIYLGYFLNLPTLLELYGPDYSAMRLPWVLSGYVLNAVLPPTLAHFALMLGTQLLATGSLYSIVLPRYGRRAGFLAVGLLTLNPLWIGAVTRGYVDGLAVGFSLACFAVVANRASFATRWVPAALVGAFGSLAFFTHPIVGVMTLVGTIAWLVVQRIELRELWRMAVIAAVSGVALSFVFGAISLAVNGPFLFWTVMSDMTKRALGGFGSSYARPLEDWWPSAYLQFVLIAILVCGLVALGVTRRGGQRSELLKAGCGTLGASLILFAVMSLKSASSMFQSPFYLSLLFPGAALILGGLAGEALRGPRRDSLLKSIACAAGVLAAGCLPLVGAAQIWRIEDQVRPDRLLWVLLIGLGVVACVSLWRAKLFAVLVLVGALGIAGVADPSTRSMYQVAGNPSYEPMFLAQHRLNDFVRENQVPNRVIFWWYDRDDFRQSEVARQWLWYHLWYKTGNLELTVYDSLSSLWLWDQRALLLGPEMPAIEKRARFLQLMPTAVVMFCAEPAQCKRAERALQLPGHVARLRAQERIVEPPYLDFTVAIVDVDRVAP